MLDRYRGLLPRGSGMRGLLVSFLALLTSLLEAVGAVLIFTLIGLAAEPGGSLEIPLVGDPRALMPDLADDTLLIGTAVTVGVFFVARSAIILLQTYVQTRVANAIGVDIAGRLLERYLRLPYSFHLQVNSSELIRNAHEAITEVVNDVLIPLVRLFAQVCVVLGLTIVLVIAQPVTALLTVLIVAPIVVGSMRYVQPRIGRQGAISQREHARSIQLLQHSLHGYRDVTVLGRQRYFIDAFTATRERIARTRERREVLSAVPRLVVETTAISLIALFVVVSVVGAGDRSSLAVIGLFGYAALRIMPAMNQITNYVNQIRYGRAALSAVQGHLRLDAPEWPESLTPLTFEERILVRGVHFRYQGADRDTLTDLNLSIGFGQSVGVVGATGAGKSTLLDILIGLSTPTRGRVTIDGIDLAGNERAWQASIGLVSQQVFLLDDTLRRNVALGVPDHEVDEEALLEAISMAQLDALLQSLPEGLETRMGERGVRVSGGQRQRIAIARALYSRPTVLFFDEGTSALDNLTEAALLEALETLRGKHTIITVAHRLSTVQDHDLIVFLDDGRILDMGRFNELLDRNQRFRQLARSSRP